MLNKKSVKIFKIFISSSSVALFTTLGLTTISCGHKSPAAKKHTWNEFKKDANAETAMKIVQATKPVGWEDASEAKLNIINRVSDDVNHDIALDITYDTKSEKASFKIEYKDDEVYDSKNWTCVSQPVGWDDFKALALKITPEQLIAQARNSQVTDKLSWIYGTDEQRKWQTSDKAEFDTTRGTIKGSSNPFKGMKGQATVDEQKHTITAIISKSGENIPDYAADPIKAMITYGTIGQTYNIKDWTFSAIKQLQSEDAAKNSGILAALDLAKKINVKDNFENFDSNNWIVINNINGNQKENELSKHHEPSSGGIANVLKDSNYNIGNITAWEYVRGNTFNGAIKNGGQQIGVLAEMVLSCHSDKGANQIILDFKYMYANGINNSGGGNAFANVWEVKNVL